jgi:hypothetical protein
MATILKGKRKGEVVELHQWCNDWVSLADGTVMSVTNLHFIPKEIERLRESNSGTLFFEFTLADGRFRRKKR